jgi:hypothetical protein
MAAFGSPVESLGGASDVFARFDTGVEKEFDDLRVAAMRGEDQGRGAEIGIARMDERGVDGQPVTTRAISPQMMASIMFLSSTRRAGWRKREIARGPGRRAVRPGLMR